MEENKIVEEIICRWENDPNVTALCMANYTLGIIKGKGRTSYRSEEIEKILSIFIDAMAEEATKNDKAK